MSGLQEAGHVRTRHSSARHSSAETSAAHPDVRIGVIGAGRIGKIHAANLTQRVDGTQVIAIADPRLEAARELAGRLHIPRALADYRALLADPEIEAVVICSSTDTHAQIIAEAAQVRKHIFCEKPIAHDLSRIDEALDVVAAARVKLQIGFNRRFDPSFLPTPPSPYESSAGGVGKDRLWAEMSARGHDGLRARPRPLRG